MEVSLAQWARRPSYLDSSAAEMVPEIFAELPILKQGPVGIYELTVINGRLIPLEANVAPN
jgi:hypothetical protein